MKIMKKLLSLLLLLSFSLFWTACEKTDESAEEGDGTELVEENPENQENPNATPDMPTTTVAFEEESHNFGKIKDGDKVQHVFKFKNTGTEKLVVKNVKPSCGCTTPDWTKDPIEPGGEGYINIEFDSSGKVGTQNKSVTVELNTAEKVKTLTFTGEVVSK
jgi:hypothetical protein